MKKLVIFGSAALLAVSLAACGGKNEGEFAGQTLHIYNWGEYTGENLISDFEELTGCDVVMDNFESNEQMYIRVANGDSYDILVPSDYMIERLLQEDRTSWTASINWIPMYWDCPTIPTMIIPCPISGELSA